MSFLIKSTIKKQNSFFIYLLFIPILASFGCFIAYDYFATPSLHGIISGDALLFLLILLLPRKSKFKILILLGAFATSIFFNPVIGVCLVIATAISFVKRDRISLLSIVLVSPPLLFSIVADSMTFFEDTFMMDLPQLWNVSSFFWWGTLLFFLVPLGYCATIIFFSRKILWEPEKFIVNPFAFFGTVLFILLANVGFSSFQSRMQLVDFPIYRCFRDYNVFKPFGNIEKGMSYVKSESLSEDTKKIFSIWNPQDSSIIKKKAVFVLVESYGVNKDTTIAKQMIFSPFTGAHVSFSGILPRRSMHTQGAEVEDLGYANYFDSTEIKFLSSLKKENIESWYLHGYVGEFYSRAEKYKQFGFDSLLFMNDLNSKNAKICHYGFVGICDSSMINVLDSILYRPGDKFVFWTTLDSHPPYDGNLILPNYSLLCKNLKVSDKECIYYSMIENTLKQVLKLAQRHPDYQFVIRGDHRPMATIDPDDFYFAWVPMIILN